jgi:hypothetical protein
VMGKEEEEKKESNMKGDRISNETQNELHT